LPEFADYEFADNARAFLDGSVLPKILVDFGYAAVIGYILVLARFVRDPAAMLALCVTGLFINYLSVSPATVMTFALLSGAYFDRRPAPVSSTFRAKRATLPISSTSVREST
jgi:hypothetical protein